MKVTLWNKKVKTFVYVKGVKRISNIEEAKQIIVQKYNGLKYRYNKKNYSLEFVNLEFKEDKK